MSIIKESLAIHLANEQNLIIAKCTKTVTGITGKAINILGQMTLKINLDNNTAIIHTFLVMRNANSSFQGGVLIGMDLLNRFPTEIRFAENGQSGLLINKILLPFVETKFLQKNHNYHIVRNNATNSDSQIIKLNKTMTFQREQVVQFSVKAPKDVISGKTYLVHSDFELDSPLRLACGLVSSTDGTIPVQLVNVSQNDIIVPANAWLGHTELCEVEIDVDIPEIDTSDLDENLEKLNNGSTLDHLNPSEKNDLMNLIRKHKTTFSSKNSPVGCTQEIAEILRDPNQPIINIPQYRLAQPNRPG